MASHSFEFLRRVELFANLPEKDLDEICQSVEEIRLKAGDILFTEGTPGEYAYVIEEGRLEVYKTAEGREIQVDVRNAGDVIGEIALLESTTRTASVRAMDDSLLLVISEKSLDHLLDTNPSAARILLHTVASRLRKTELTMRQSEKMAQLGTLAAGIAHELNNPASAARRGAEQLTEALSRIQAIQLKMNSSPFSENQIAALSKLDEQARQAARNSLELDTLTRSDREAVIEDWLDSKGVEDSWEVAPRLVNLNASLEQLSQIDSQFSEDTIPLVVAWWAATSTVYSLMDEIKQGATRISEIVKALKEYTYLDQAPIQEIDLHEGIDSTIVMLRHKLKQGVEVHREYDPQIPRIQAHGSELNQVWTNIIDNAIDAMDGKGQIFIRTEKQDPWVLVSIQDNGPGIPADIQPKLFDPFFTTKAVGKGTGLGLNISYNIVRKHGGEIKVFSQPGQTRFEVCLPLDLRNIHSDHGTKKNASGRPDDETLKSLLNSIHTIAVVGLSNKPERPANSVPAYLQQHGYRIIPVNPNLEQALGEKAYPDLLAVPEKVDAVQIFRVSEAVPPIVDQAIQIGARVVWMQEGISHEPAAEKARQAGLIVVSNLCMRATHMRLFGHKPS